MNQPGPSNEPLQCRILRQRVGTLRAADQYILQVCHSGQHLVSLPAAVAWHGTGVCVCRPVNARSYPCSCSWTTADTSCWQHASVRRANARITSSPWSRCAACAGSANQALEIVCGLLSAYSHYVYMGVHQRLQADLARHSSAYVGKVRSNFIGTEFTCYDSGVSPAKASGAIRGEHCLHADLYFICTDACC